MMRAYIAFAMVLFWWFAFVYALFTNDTTLAVAAGTMLILDKLEDLR